MERTISREVGVAHFYFNYKQVADQQSGHGKQQTADHVIASLLKQLLQHKEIPQALLEAYDKWEEHGQRNRPDAKFFAGLIQRFSKEFRACFIVFDAFDECAEQERASIITYVQEFLSSGIKVYATTRLHLRDFLHESFGTEASLVEIKANPVDVERFVTVSLKDKRMSESLKTEVLRVIREAEARESTRLNHSNSRFLLVRFQLDYILAKPANIRSTFNGVPQNVPDAYRGVIERIEKSPSKTTAFKILSWLLLARRVLTMIELQEALSVDLGVQELIPETELIDPRYVVECCESLINHDKNTQTVRLTHYTLNDFLNTECATILPTSIYLARTCLTYLNFDEFDKPCRTQELVKERLQLFHFLDYANSFWYVHVQGDAELDQDIQQAIFRFSATPSRQTSFEECRKFRLDSYFYYRYDWSIDIFETPLHAVSRYGLSKICKKLLDGKYHLLADMGLNFSFPNERMDFAVKGWKGRTPLHHASRYGYVEVVKLLLTTSDIDAIDDMRNTALILAAKYRHCEIVHLLIDSGADVNANNDNEVRALHYAAENGSVEMVRLLIGSGADVNAKTDIGWTALQNAMAFDSVEVVKLLIASGAEVNKGGIATTMTALHYAVGCKEVELVRQLIDSGADVNAKVVDGRTALHFASEAGDLEMARLLIDSGADVNAKALEGTTALRLAARFSEKEMAMLLIDSGADVFELDDDGETALDIAISSGCQETATILENSVRNEDAG